MRQHPHDRDRSDLSHSTEGMPAVWAPDAAPFGEEYSLVDYCLDTNQSVAPDGSSEADGRDREAQLRDRAADARDDVGDRRDRAAAQRDQAGAGRDQAADLRDHAADLRDNAANLRDRIAESCDPTIGSVVTADSIVRTTRSRRDDAADRSRAACDRRAAAGDRRQAELDRDLALIDRGEGASERLGAGLDRLAAQSDRAASGDDRTLAWMDRLTGAYLRDAGIAELERDMARARRADQTFVAAIIDVDRTDAIEGSRGPEAVERMVLEVATALRAKFRPYDLVVRYADNEFVCGISGLAVEEAKRRFAILNIALSAAPEHGSVTFGLAEFNGEDTVINLVERAAADRHLAREAQQLELTQVPTLSD
jgi:diguanylate cyclase (GGDEF)-like protein